MGAQQTKPTIVEVSDSSTPYIIEDPYVFKYIIFQYFTVRYRQILNSNNVF